MPALGGRMEINMKKAASILAAVVIALSASAPSAFAAESWRDAFVTRLMKVMSSDTTYSEVVLTDLDKNGVPEAYVLRDGMNGGIAQGFTLSGSMISQINVPSNIIGECLTDITVYQKEGRDIFVGKEIPRYSSVLYYYKLELIGSDLVCTKINKEDVSPYPTIPYVDMHGKDFLTNGYPNRTKIVEFVNSYEAVNQLTAEPSKAKISINGNEIEASGYTVNYSNYYKIRDIAMMLRTTPKRFNVTWDSNLGGISIITGEKYDIIGGELADEDYSGIPSIEENTSPVYVDRNEKPLTAYNINGSNYFKIRDIADVIGFGVDWDEANQTIVITTD